MAKSKYGLINSINFEDWYNAFLGLDQRRQVLFVLLGVIAFAVILILPITCASSKLGALETEYEKARKGASEISQKIADYKNAQANLEQIRERLRAGGGSLTTVIESLANEVGIGSNIDRLKPMTFGNTDYYEEEGIDAVVSKVSLEQVTDLLGKIENYQGMPVKLKKLTIKPRYGKREELTVSFQVATLKLKGGESE